MVVGGLIGACALAPILPATCSMMRGGKDPPRGKPPVRPQGQAKPMLEEDIAPVLARLDRWYSAYLPSPPYALRPPAPATAIDAIQTMLGVTLPRAYRQLYQWHDGEDDDRWGHIYGLPLIPLQWATAEWKSWQRVLAGFKGDRYAIPGGSWPAGAVDPAYINPRWLPLTADGSGNHIGLDFDPWPKGRVGQVILFGRDEDVKTVLAESLGGFLGWIADLLEAGNFRLGKAPGETILRQFRLKVPRSDSFHNGARTLRGSPGPFL
jgi:cell wall assembly regulator SMI1